MSQDFGVPHDIVIPQGATWREQFTYKSIQYDFNFTPPKVVGELTVDLSTYTPKGQVRKLPDVTSAVLGEMTFDTSNAATGVIVATLNASVTTNIDEDAFYDIKLTGQGVNPEVIRLVGGKAYISRAVTYG